MSNSSYEEMSTSHDGSSEEEEAGKHKGKTSKKKKSLKSKLDYKLLFIEETEEELKYRRKLFRNDDDILNAEVKCTSCNRNLIGIIKYGESIFRHLTLNVLLCKKCMSFFGDGEFSTDEDGTDKYCRWCGQGGTLYCCSKCPCAFCKACIKRNLSASVLTDLEQEDWLCLICNSRPLWRLRALCAASQQYINHQKRLAAEKRKRNLLKLEEIRNSPKKRRVLRRGSSSDFESRCGTPEAGCSGIQVKNDMEVKRNGRPVRGGCVNKLFKGNHENSEVEINEVSDDERVKGSKKQERKLNNSNELQRTATSNTGAASQDCGLDDDMPEICDEKMSNKALMWLQDTVSDICDVLKDANENVKLLSEKKVKLKNASKPVKVSRLVNYFHKICQGLRGDLDSIESDLDLCYDHWNKSVVRRGKKRSHLEKGTSLVTTNSNQVVEDDGAHSNVKSEPVRIKVEDGEQQYEDSGNKVDFKLTKLEIHPFESETEVDSASEVEMIHTKKAETINPNETEKVNTSEEEIVDLSEAEMVHTREAEAETLHASEAEAETVHASEVETVHSSEGVTVFVQDVSKTVKDTTKDSSSALDVEGIASKLVSNISEVQSGILRIKSKSKSASSQLSGIDMNDEDNSVETGFAGETRGIGSIVGQEESLDVCITDPTDEQEADKNRSNKSVEYIGRKKKLINEDICNSEDEEKSPMQTINAEAEVSSMQGSHNEKDTVSATALNPCKDGGNKTSAENFDSTVLETYNMNESEDMFEGDDTEVVVHNSISEDVDKSRNINRDKVAACGGDDDDEDRHSVSTFEVLSESAEDNTDGQPEAPVLEEENSVKIIVEKKIVKPLIFVRKDLMANSYLVKLEVDDATTNHCDIGAVNFPAMVNGELSKSDDKPASDTEQGTSLTEEAVKARQALLECSSDGSGDEQQKRLKKRKRKKLALKKCNIQETEIKSNRTKRRIGPRNKVKQKVESDVDSDALDSDETNKCARSLKKIKMSKYLSDLSGVYENDKKLKLMAKVDIQRLTKDEEEKYKSKYIDEFESSETDDDEERINDMDSKHDKEVNRLCNLKLLKRSRNRGSSCSGDDVIPQRKKKQKKDKDKVAEDDSSEGSKKFLSDIDDYPLLSDTQDEPRQIARQESVNMITENDMAKKMLLDMSSSDDSGEIDEQDDNAKTKKSQKSTKIGEKDSKKVNDDDGGDEESLELPKSAEALDSEMVPGADDEEKKSSIPDNDGDDEKQSDKAEDEKFDDKDESEDKKKTANIKKEEDASLKDESDNSSGQDSKVVRKKWRRDKLLSGKLSLTDSSEEERRWEKNKAKREAMNENESDGQDSTETKQRQKRNPRKVLRSDSDEYKNVSDDDDSSDSDFVTSKKKQSGKKNKSESDSVQTIDSDSSSKKKRKPKRKRIRQPVSDSSDSDVMEASQRSEGQGKGRKNIRRVIKDEDVAEATRRAAREEDDRRKRIAEKQKYYNELYEIPENFEVLDKLVLDFDPETKEELVSVHPNLVRKLKPHQVKGVKFMWDACFESVREIKKNKGTGCILAHCMGLGKTFQVVTLAHTVLSNKATKVKTILVVVPKSTVLNWIAEFKFWLKDTKSKFMIGDLSKTKQYKPRMLDLRDWHLRGGIMVLSYEMFRDLVLLGPQKLRKKADVEQLHEALLEPGPDLVVCDEGHLLKNESTKISKAMTKIGTLRRIVLTGTPLQNNLAEYHCMVQFVKPNLLGTRREFQNRFVNPINNGSYVDSNAHDVKVMKRRAHVLHKMLDSSVQRFDYAVLTPYLPPKQEYAIFIRLTELQIKLYRRYLDLNAPELKARTAKLFSDFHNLQRVCTHPRVLQMQFEKNEKNAEMKRLMESDSEESLKDFIDDGSSSESVSNKTTTSDSDVVCVEEENEPSKRKGTRRTRQNADAESEDEPVVQEEVKKYQEWWQSLIEDDSVFSNLTESGKLTLLFYILRECEKIGDKVLVFSQSLSSLDLIEYFLHQIDEATQNDSTGDSLCNHAGSWSRGLDYFRFDGGTSLDNRSSFCKAFNSEGNSRARLFLISTKAGGLGINLFGANRVIIFDASWNPSHDVQSIFRVYRFGQKKPCYIYRFLAKGTMEEKIYDRQVTKLSLSCRVVDEQQIERHYNMADLQELYNFNPESSTTESTPKLPKDRLLAEMLKEYEKVIETYHEHDSLLENKEEEELNEEERKAAWEDYENEKKGRTQIMGGFQTGGLPHIDSGAIRDQLRKENPAITDQELDAKLAETVQRIMMYMRSVQQNQMINDAAIQAAQNQLFQQQLRAFGYQQPQQMFKTTPVLQNIATKQSYPVIKNNSGIYPMQFPSTAGGYVYNSNANNLPKVSNAALKNSKLKAIMQQQQQQSSSVLPKVDASNKPVFLNPAAANRKMYTINMPRELPTLQGTAGKTADAKQASAKPSSTDDIETID